MNLRTKLTVPVVAGTAALATVLGIAVGTSPASAGVMPAGVYAPLAASCDSPATNNPRTCAEAVAWANSHINAYSSSYDHMCDYVVALAYGRSASGHVSAAEHWDSTPSMYKHSGTDVPAGGLAFFAIPNSPYGHVMISLGGGEFLSNDIVEAGRLSETTIGTIESRWGGQYLGWSNPWF